MAGGVEVKIDSADFDKNMRETSSNFKVLARQGLENAAELVEFSAGRLAPYDRGHLRRSIAHKVYTDFAEVGSDVVYARIQEFGGVIKFKTRKGTVTIPPHPYLRPALTENIPEITRIFNKLMQKI